MKVFISADAEADLRQIADFIAHDNPLRAATFTAELRRKAMAIGQFPRAYPRKPNLGPNHRAAIHRPYVIVFRIEDEKVYVVRILHGARDLSAIFNTP